MSSNLEDTHEGKVRYYGMQIGIVTDNADPAGLHRVRVEIPALVEPASDWLLPLTAGGGSPKRGGHIVPAVGSTVAVWFQNGDLEAHGGYLCLNWGVPKEGSELPGDLLDEENAEQVQTLEIDNLRITLDERAGKRSFKIVDVDPTTGAPLAAIVLDRETRGVLISATSAIVLKTVGMIILDATEIRLGDRRVATSDKAV